MIKIERIKYYVFAVFGFGSIRFEKHKHVQHVTFFFYKPVIVAENLAKLIFAKLTVFSDKYCTSNLSRWQCLSNIFGLLTTSL